MTQNSRNWSIIMNGLTCHICICVMIFTSFSHYNRAQDHCIWGLERGLFSITHGKTMTYLHAQCFWCIFSNAYRLKLLFFIISCLPFYFILFKFIQQVALLTCAESLLINCWESLQVSKTELTVEMIFTKNFIMLFNFSIHNTFQCYQHKYQHKNVD